MIRSGLKFLLFMTFIGCSSSPKKVDPTPSKKLHQIMARQLTFQGENKQARFSPEGNKIIYISKKRPRHKNSQIYEMNLSTEEERRITHQDGELKDPIYAHDGPYIYYASTTDELKESPLFIKNKLQQMKHKSDKNDLTNSPFLSGSELLPYEIYKSHLDGESIERITHSPHLDHEPHLHPFKKVMVFSSVRSGGLELFLSNLRSKKVSQFTKGPRFKGEAKFSHKGDQLLWIAYDPKENNSHIYVQNMNTGQQKKLSSLPGHHWFPEWTPDDEWIVFTANIKDPKNFDLYLISKNGQCLQQLTYNPSFESYPAIHPAGDQLLFTSDRTGTAQIYLMDLKKPKACTK